MVSVNGTPDTTYTEGNAIQSTSPNHRIDWKPDTSTLGINNGYGACIKVLASNNITMNGLGPNGELVGLMWFL